MAQSALISAAVGILNGLVPLATQQISLAWGFKKDLEALRRRLTNIQALLTDAERKRIESAALNNWLKSLNAGTCRAENVLDKLSYEALRRKVEGQDPLMDKVRNLAFRFKMAYKVNDVNKLLKEICNEANEIGLSPANLVAGASIEPREFRPTDPFIDESNVVGRQVDVSVVVNMLLGSNEEDNLPVIAIQGMGGLGKTTLAKLVYNDKKVVEKFGDKKMWICVSDKFKVDSILNEMVQSLTGDKSEIPNIEGIVKTLKELKLNEHKYLLVLDDLWNTDPQKWVDMRNSLMAIGGSKESKILVTTRSMDVVSAMQVPSHLSHRLGILSYDDCWAMFKKRVFSAGGPIEMQSLMDIGERIVKKCKGVPLAVNSLGGLMYTKHSEQEWESIDKSETWSSLETEIGILPILRLSFDHLPSPSLKRCFAYCAVFQKDDDINKDELIHCWMGLGYLHPSPKSKLEMEDLGNDYFNKLLRNSFFQEPKLDKFHNVTTCKMHDLVHDLALDVAGGNCSTLEVSEVKNHPGIQHLSLHLKEETILGIRQENARNLRGLSLTGHLPKKVDAAKCVRVLSLIGTGEKELPSSMRKFIHLRYLDLSCTKLANLPNFISCLYNLETLVLPSSLQKLPNDFCKLINLRHLCMDESKISPNVIPAKLGQLTSLQTLPLFVVGEDTGHKIEELGSLKKLRGRLRVNNLMLVNSKEEAKGADIVGKKDIQQLIFHFGLERPYANHADVLEGLQPHKNLKGLILEEYGGHHFASWMPSANAQSLQNLVEIKLSNCKVCEHVPALGHLQHLEVVKMEGLDEVRCIGPDFYGLDRCIASSSSTNGAAKGREVFPVLRKLCLRNMGKLEEWSDVSSLPAAATNEIEFFPCLKEVIISNCPRLVILPSQLLSVQFQSLCISRQDDRWRENEMRDRPSFFMGISQESENIAPLLEDLLGKSSRSLRKLEINGLGRLRCLPNQLLNLSSLKDLVIEGCSDLIYLAQERDVTSSTGLLSLQQLMIWDCPELRCLPKGLLQPNLAELRLEWCGSLECDESCSLVSLKKLTIVDCSRWGSFWEKGLVCPTSLEELRIGEFSELDYFPWPCYSQTFISLESLELLGWANLRDTCLPNLDHLPALKDLKIWGWDKLTCLPEWLSNLSSLQSLEIYNCPNLMSLPSQEAIQRLANLQRLFIYNCPILGERVQRGSSEEWHKIAHIPSVDIGDASDYYTEHL